jgi:hypothetical protein
MTEQLEAALAAAEQAVEGADALLMATALHKRMRALVWEHSKAVREILPLKYDDAGWEKQGCGLVALFLGLEVNMQMLREAPQTTLVHYSGISLVHCHHLLSQLVGLSVGSDEHGAIAGLIAAALKGAYSAGS